MAKKKSMAGKSKTAVKKKSAKKSTKKTTKRK